MKPSREKEMIERILRDVPLPDYVAEVLYEFGNDWAGEPAVFLFVIVQDSQFEKHDGMNQVLNEADPLLFETIQSSELERWPYIRYRSVSEQKQFNKDEVAQRKQREKVAA